MVWVNPLFYIVQMDSNWWKYLVSYLWEFKYLNCNIQRWSHSSSCNKVNKSFFFLQMYTDKVVRKLNLRIKNVLDVFQRARKDKIDDLVKEVIPAGFIWYSSLTFISLNGGPSENITNAVSAVFSIGSIIYGVVTGCRSTKIIMEREKQNPVMGWVLWYQDLQLMSTKSVVCYNYVDSYKIHLLTQQTHDRYLIYNLEHLLFLMLIVLFLHEE